LDEDATENDEYSAQYQLPDDRWIFKEKQRNKKACRIHVTFVFNKQFVRHNSDLLCVVLATYSYYADPMSLYRNTQLTIHDLCITVDCTLQIIAGRLGAVYATYWLSV
jgi:hypothetical protein